MLTPDVGAPPRIGLGEPTVPCAPLNLLDSGARLTLEVHLDKLLEQISTLEHFGRTGHFVCPDRKEREGLYVRHL